MNIDNVIRDRFENIGAVIDAFGNDREDWPESLVRAVDNDEWPIVVESDSFGVDAGVESEMPDEETWAIRVLAADLAGFDILHDADELAEYDPGHNPPRRSDLEDARAFLAGCGCEQFERAD